MGHRANYVIIQNKKRRLFYSHWSAITVDRDLFWGPDESSRFISEQREVDAENWLDSFWCEGGAVVNLDEKKLTLFGGEKIKGEIPIRRLFLRLLAQTWNSWSITWAHEGIADLADAARYPRERVLSRRTPDDAAWPPLQEGIDNDLLGQAVLSVEMSPNQLNIYQLRSFFVERLWEGYGVLEQLFKLTSRQELIVPKQLGLPGSGIHMSLHQKSMELWTAVHHSDVVNALRSAWRGWKISWFRDEFEFQEDRTNGRVQFPRFDDVDLLPRLADIILYEARSPRPAARFDSMTKTPEDSSHADGALPREQRLRIWERAIDAAGLK